MSTINWCTCVRDSNGNCIPNQYYQTFINPQSSPPGQIVNPGAVPTGVYGEWIKLKAGDPQNAPVPSQYYPIELCFSSGSSAICPSCAGNNLQTGCNGGAVYQQNIECCNTGLITCGSQQGIDVNLKPGNMQGPTKSGVACLINESDHGSNAGTGQDTLCTTTVLPPLTNATCAGLKMYAGANNPSAAVGSEIDTSYSVVSVPIYKGYPLCPGGSCPSNISINVIGFLVVFINQVELNNGGTSNMGDVDATIVDIVSCGAGNGGGGGGSGTGGGGGSGSGGSVSGGGGSAIPIRLIQNP